MSDWVETKDRLPDENAGRLEFTDGKRPYKGYFKNGRFVAEPGPDAGGVPSFGWEPNAEIIKWRQMEDNELYS